MIKADLVKKVAASTKLNLRESEVVVNKVFSSIAELIKAGEKLELRGFGTFGAKRVEAKVGRIIATGQAVALPPYLRPYFKPGVELKPWPVIVEKPAAATVETALPLPPEDKKQASGDRTVKGGGPGQQGALF